MNWSKPPIYDEEPIIDEKSNSISRVFVGLCKLQAFISSTFKSSGQAKPTTLLVSAKDLMMAIEVNGEGITINLFEVDQCSHPADHTSKLPSVEVYWTLIGDIFVSKFEDSSLKFRFEKVNVKYKVDSAKKRFHKLFKVET